MLKILWFYVWSTRCNSCKFLVITSWIVLGFEEGNCCGSFQLKAPGSQEGGACLTGKIISIGCGLEAQGLLVQNCGLRKDYMIPFYEGNLPTEYDNIPSQLSCGINGNSLNWKIVASIANLALGLFRFIFCSNNYTLLMHLLHFSSILMIYICSSGFLGQ